MTIRCTIIIFFLLCAVLIPLIAPQEFVANYNSSMLAMIGSCIIIALLFWVKQVVIINIIIAFYVFYNYLTFPFISSFENLFLSKDFLYTDAYVTPESSAVVYWSLFSLLLAWLLGLLVLKSPKSNSSFWYPKLFRQFDCIITLNGRMLPFLMAFGLLSFLNYKPPSSLLHSGATGEGTGLFLWGIASTCYITYPCLYAFLERWNKRLKPAKYYLLVPALGIGGYSALAGSRGAVFGTMVISLVYLFFLNFYKKWGLRTYVKFILLTSAILSIAVIVGLFAQALKPLYKFSNDVNSTMILDTLDYETILLAKDNFLLGITQLLHRLNALKAQYYILNDWYIHEPWLYYNPFTSLMRTANALVPGGIFNDILNIHQLFDFIYYGTLVNYSSEMWSIQGTLYLYFGHILAPVAVFISAILISRIYPLLERLFIQSPSFAAFFNYLFFDIMTNGTIERIIPVDVVRPILSIFIFIFVYKAFSIFLSNIQGVKKTY